jgi:hypothetical protein
MKSMKNQETCKNEKAQNQSATVINLFQKLPHANYFVKNSLYSMPLK